MVENYNKTSEFSGEYVDVKKYVGVGSVSILAVNPKNSTLRKYGWSVPEGAEEPAYTFTREVDGQMENYAKVRFLLRINDFVDKPVVAYDIWIRPGFVIGKNSGKCKIIDSYGYTAWATQEDIQKKQIPQYATGPAQIHSDYKGCHPGQDKLVAFLMKFLNVTPLQTYDSRRGEWTNTTNPGRLTIDNWKALCNGDAKEIEEYIRYQPDNLIKLIFGVRTNEENKTYQVVLDDCDGSRKTPFLANSQRPDKQTGEYSTARKRIDDYFKSHENADNITFSALPVREWKETATEVKDNTMSMFDKANSSVEDDGTDLPF